MHPSIWGTLSLAALALLSGFLSAARTALSSVRRQTLRERAEAGSSSARQALAVAEDSARMLSTFRLAVTVVNFLLAGLLVLLTFDPVRAWLGERLALQAWVLDTLTYLLLLPTAGVLASALLVALPEAIAQRNPVDWAIRLAAPARVTEALFMPLVSLLSWVRRGFTAADGDTPDTSLLVTEEEIMTLVDAGEEEGSIELEEKEMIYSIFQLDETLAREIMVPRIDVVALDINTPLVEARRVIIEAGHSRIPVFEESLDHIRGLLYAKDLLDVWDDDGASLGSLLRPAVFIPETKRVSDLLRELQTAKVHLAVVIDEYGGTAGLVTIEDIVEEIVGEILDEYDENEESTYEMLSPDEYVFDGRIDMDDFNRLLDTSLPTGMGDTLGGFIYGQLGKVPEEGEVIETDGLVIEVLSVVDRRIRKVSVRRTDRRTATTRDLPEASPEEEVVRNGNEH